MPTLSVQGCTHSKRYGKDLAECLGHPVYSKGEPGCLHCEHSRGRDQGCMQPGGLASAGAMKGVAAGQQSIGCILTPCWLPVRQSYFKRGTVILKIMDLHVALLFGKLYTERMQ